MTKFTHIPLDEDTKVLEQSLTVINGINAMHQKWVWDGIQAESLIFVSSDVSGMDESALKAWVSASDYAKGEFSERMTYSQNETGYTFVNFNFKVL